MGRVWAEKFCEPESTSHPFFPITELRQTIEQGVKVCHNTWRQMTHPGVGAFTALAFALTKIALASSCMRSCARKLLTPRFLEGMPSLFAFGKLPIGCKHYRQHTTL